MFTGLLGLKRFEHLFAARPAPSGPGAPMSISHLDLFHHSKIPILLPCPEKDESLAHGGISWSIRGRPHDLRFLDPSYLLAMNFRYQLSSVSGLAAAAKSSSAFRPSRWAISARVAFSASDNNNRPLIFARRIRFSAAKYSFLSSSSWFTVPVTYARTRAQIIPEPP